MTVLESLDLLLERMAAGLPARTHSGQVKPGEVFVAMPSTGGPAGLDFVDQAIANGATWIVAEEDAVDPAMLDAFEDGVRWVLIRDARRALGQLAAAHFNTHALSFPLVGVTGTNGKTTVCCLLEQLFQATDKVTGFLGTVAQRWADESRPAGLTTPGCWELHEIMAAMERAGVQAAFMEVSSHALHQQRVAGLRFACAVFTNLTQDHLDYHKTMDAYGEAKALLFECAPDADKPCVVNWDDPFGRKLLARVANPVGYGLTDPAHAADGAGVLDSLARRGGWGLAGRLVAAAIDGVTLEVELVGTGHPTLQPGAVWTLRSPLIGRHNAANLLAAQAAGLSLGLVPEDLLALERCQGVPGRLERVHNPGNRNVFVDYAHTPDALDNVLAAMRELTPGRLVTVFGCGGDRDRAKRPLMGQAACRWSDVAVLTSDNPRTEDPLSILDDVRPGLAACAEVHEEVDRRAAIHHALAMLGPQDALCIAGKGHEDYQIIGTEKRPFSDQATVREFFGRTSLEASS